MSRREEELRRRHVAEVSELSGVEVDSKIVEPSVKEEPSFSSEKTKNSSRDSLNSIPILFQSLCRQLFAWLFTPTIQFYLRDCGVFRYFSDVMIMIAIPSIVFTNPHLVKLFLSVSLHATQIPYFSTHSHRTQHPLSFDLTVAPILSTDAVSTQQATTSTTGAAAPLPPILLFIHGGAWGSGKPWFYRVITDRLGGLIGASHATIAGYPVYPDGDITIQRLAVAAAVRAVHEDPRVHAAINGPLNGRRLILMGHSSGGNIATLGTLDLIASGEGHLVSVLCNLSSVFHIEDHYAHESSRGVQNFSPMAAAAGLTPENFSECSPTHICASFKDTGFLRVPPKVSKRIMADVVPVTTSVSFAEKVKQDNSNTDDRMLRIEKSDTYPVIALLHGKNDAVVPYSASEKFATVASNIFPAVESIYTSFDHGCPLFQALDNNETEMKSAMRELFARVWKECDRLSR